MIVGDKKSPKGYNMNWANKETDEKGEERKEKKETVGSIAGNITSPLSPPPRSRRALREENATSSASDPPPEASHQRVYYLSPENQEALKYTRIGYTIMSIILLIIITTMLIKIIMYFFGSYLTGACEG